jgi:hypothetical protein
MNTKIVTLLILAAGLFVACSSDLDGIESDSAVLVGANLSNAVDSQLEDAELSDTEDCQCLEVTLFGSNLLTTVFSGATSAIVIQRNWTDNAHLSWRAMMRSGDMTYLGTFASGSSQCTIQYTAPENPTESNMICPVMVIAVDGSWTFTCNITVRPASYTPIIL